MNVIPHNSLLLSYYYLVLQQIVIDELDQVFEDSDRPVTTQDIVECKYLECCIKETLRLYPSVPAVMRCLTEDVELGTVSFLNLKSWKVLSMSVIEY